METKIAELCGRCAAIYEETFNVKRVSGGVNHKVICSVCGNRRYGGTYEITNKKNKEANKK